MTAMRMTDEEFDKFCRKHHAEYNRTFGGPRKAAVARLRRMVEIACEHLPAAKLNHLSYHMATHIDVTLRDRGVWHSNLNHQVSEELDSENPKRGRKVAVIRPRHH